MELDEVILRLQALRGQHGGGIRVFAGYQQITSVLHNGAISDEAQYINIGTED